MLAALAALAGADLGWPLMSATPPLDPYVQNWCDTLKADPPPPQPCWTADELRRRSRQRANASLGLTEAVRIAATNARGQPIFPSEGGQERWLWMHHLRHLGRPPVYADFGSNDALHDSNTFFLDTCAGATSQSICVDAQRDVAPRFAAWRKCSFTHSCLSDKAREVTFAMGGTKEGASTRSGVLSDNKTYKKGARGEQKAHVNVKMTCTTGAALFTKHGLTHIDLLDLDAEGHEAAILSGIDWHKVTIDIILVEANDRAVTRLLTSKGYSLLATPGGNGRLHRDDVFLRDGFQLLRQPDATKPAPPVCEKAAARHAARGFTAPPRPP